MQEQFGVHLLKGLTAASMGPSMGLIGPQPHSVVCQLDSHFRLTPLSLFYGVN